MGLSLKMAVSKRMFDVFFSVFGLLLTGWFITLMWIACSIDTRSNGLYVQTRVGRFGNHFKIYKLKTMVDPASNNDELLEDKSRITRLGALLRKSKIDELPQLFNILKGDMSVVGPRPDVPGFADLLTGEDRVILDVRPGLTGPASLQFRDEEDVLARVSDANSYNISNIWPEKVEINKKYVLEWTFSGDLAYLIKTILKA